MFSIGELVEWKDDVNRLLSGRVLPDLLTQDDHSLVAVKSDQEKQDIFWVPVSALKRKVVVVAAADDEDAIHKKPKKGLHIPHHHSTPWLDICMEYLEDETTTWVQRHVLERSWMLHLPEHHPNMVYAERNDQQFQNQLQRWLNLHLNADSVIDKWWKWLPQGGVWTGSSLLALAHGVKWTEMDIDVVTSNPVPGLAPGANTMSSVWSALEFETKPLKYDRPLGAHVQFSSRIGYTMDQSYHHALDSNVYSRKLRFRSRQILNLIFTVNEGPLKPSQTIVRPNQSIGVTSQDSILSKEKDGITLNESNKEKEKEENEYQALLAERAKLPRESFHDYILRVFDMDFLCNSYDGITLRFGDGSIQARDRVAGLFGTYQRVKVDAAPRLEERLHKYLDRGATFSNYDELCRIIGHYHLRFRCVLDTTGVLNSKH